jgi:hypothetical protein
MKKVIKSHWSRHRTEQGYSHADVISEIRRRAKGEYKLSPDVAMSILKQGEVYVDRRFKLSALLLDFLQSEGVASSEEGILHLLGCVKNDCADVAIACMLNPYPKYSNGILEGNEDVDDVYPGKQLSRST